MARRYDNPRIEAQLEVLQELEKLQFDTKSYTGEFFGNDVDMWEPKWHFMQGIENYRRAIEEKVNQLTDEYEEWRKEHDPRTSEEGGKE